MLVPLLIVLALLAFTLSYATSSNDLLDISVLRSFAKIGLKYIPGYTAPLRCDSTGTFHFEQIKLEGHFDLTTGDLIRFSKAVGSASNPFLLTAKTTPLVILLLADPRCPIKPLGSVNTRNVIKMLRPFEAKDELRYVATFGGIPGRRCKRGVEFAITVDVLRGDELIMQSELWNLAFLPKSFKPEVTGRETHRPETAGSKIDTIKLNEVHPRLWAASCKDYNPIHISKLAAKAFGQTSVIAHGNHVAALLLEQLGLRDVPVKIEPQFLKPVVLPGTYDIVKHDGDVYTVEKDGRPHVRVSLSSI